MTTPTHPRDRGPSHRRTKDQPAPAATTPAASVPHTDDPITAEFKRMERTPGSGVAMCHQQGKTAVYLSADRKYIVHHPPHGPVTRTPLSSADSRPRNR